MLQYNNARLKTVLGLPHPYDYDLFVQRCTLHGVPVMPLGEFAQKVGILMCGIQLHPELDPPSAYERVIQSMNREMAELRAGAYNGAVAASSVKTEDTAPISQKGGCSGCGGGAVR